MPPKSAKHKCIEIVRNSEIKVEERGRRAVFRNPRREAVRRITVDDCVITAGPRCDSILSHPTKVDVLIELKGRDTDHACAQIQATAKFWETHVERGGSGRLGALVVCSQYPRFNDTIRRAQEYMAKAHRAPLRVSSRNELFDFDSFLMPSAPASQRPRR